MFITREEYVALLAELVSINSYYANNEGLNEILDFCISVFVKNNTHNKFVHEVDSAGNLLIYPRNFESNKSTCVVDAHLDTVDATKEQFAGKNPFIAEVSETHVIGRGACDCKAAVAFILLLVKILQQEESTYNLVFVLSRREEGNGWKTIESVAQKINNRQIPLGENNYFLVLENTVSIYTSHKELAIYDKEPSNYFFELKGTIDELYCILENNLDLQPVGIDPVALTSLDGRGEFLFEGVQGHSATLKRSQNVIWKALSSNLNEKRVHLKSERNDDLSVVPGKCHAYRDNKGFESALHRLTVNYRSLTDCPKHSNLDRYGFEWKKNPKYAAGSDRSSSKLADQMCRKILKSQNSKFRVKIESNKGRSNASAVWNKFDDETKQKFGVVTLGPGSRSHFDGKVWRKTHGENEGLHIESAIYCCNFLLKILLGCD